MASKQAKRIRNKPEALTLAHVDAAVASAKWSAKGERPQRSEDARPVARPLPPVLTGGESPISLPGIAARLVLEDGQILEVPARRGWGGSAAFCDWLNFTCDESAFAIRRNSVGVTDDEVITEVSYVCEKIFGFGITVQRPSGANFYERSYTLGDGFGLVCHGGCRNTVLVMLSGNGLTAAAPGWEGRAVEFFQRSRARITRYDLAYDDHDGAHSVTDVDTWHDNGLFNCGGRNPQCEHRGDWKRPAGKGRTFYVGSRANGKFFRAYEKGMQLGDKTSKWMRLEVEFKSVDKELPYDMLLMPGAYLAAAYPALAFISAEQSRIKTAQRAAQITYDSLCAWVHRQVGAALWVIGQIEGGADQALNKLQRVGMVPKRLKVPDRSTAGEYLHQIKRACLPADVVIEMSFN